MMRRTSPRFVDNSVMFLDPFFVRISSGIFISSQFQGDVYRRSIVGVLTEALCSETGGSGINYGLKC